MELVWYKSIWLKQLSILMVMNSTTDYLKVVLVVALLAGIENQNLRSCLICELSTNIIFYTVLSEINFVAVIDIIWDCTNKWSVSKFFEAVINFLAILFLKSHFQAYFSNDFWKQLLKQLSLFSWVFINKEVL